MKITAFIILAFFVHVSAATLAQTVTLNEHKAPLQKVINSIIQQTGYSFFYNQEWLSEAQPVDLSAKNQPLEEVLKACFKNQPFDYAIVNKTIVLKLKEKLPAKSPNEQLATSSITVTGKVTDETGQSLSGVTVKIKGTNTATATDSKGFYSLAVPDDKSFVSFSFIGYESQEFMAKDISVGSIITLKAIATNLKEVVVSKGYYNTTQELNTGNVTKVSGDEISKQPVTDPIMALEGRVAGLYINQASGIPGANETVRLRGQNSIANGNNPLYVIDGIPFTSNTLSINVNTSLQGSGLSPFNALNPADIESIEVLKDADATAIYGSRGANGVVLITTKKGISGDTRVDITTTQGAGQVTRMMDLMNTQQYLQMRHQAFTNDQKTPGSFDYDLNGVWDTTRYTNWQKVMIGGTAHLTNAQASLSGGNTNTQFILSGGYTRQTTVFPGDYSDKKISVHMGINHVSSNQKFHAQVSTEFINDNSLLPVVDFTNNITLAPDAPALYDNNGNINWQNGTWNNPLALTLKKSTSITKNLLSNVVLGYELLPGLQLKSNFSYNSLQMNQSNQQPSGIIYGPVNPNIRQNAFSTTNLNVWIIEPQITYLKKIDKATLNFLLGATQQENSFNSIGQTAYGFSSDALIPNVSAGAGIFISIPQQVVEYHYSAIYSRLNFNWDDKYLFNLTARRDGSSRFGPKTQFGNFGAIGSAWVFSKENFVQENLSFLSYGKLRASYGITGNDQLQDYQYLSTYSPYTGSTYQGVTTLAPTRIANPYFGWEVVRKLEGALELSFLKDKIQLNVDYYRNRTGNLLVPIGLPSTTGFNTIQGNLPATVQNTGLEIQLTTLNIQSGNFKWSTALNFTLPRNKLVDFPGLANNPNYNFKYVVGKSLYVQPRYHYTGINPQTGLYTFEDVNQDGILDSRDYEAVKQVSQNYFGGFSNNFSYKGWHLDFLIQFVKQTGINYLSSFATPGLFSQNQPTEVLNAWNGLGSNSTIQKFTQTGGPTLSAYANYQVSDASISDASFLRLKNLSFGYEFPEKWSKALTLKKVKVFALAQNLFTVTKYKGLDPETQGLVLPPLRMITGGIQIGL